jgi:hypothetical protein
MPVDLQIGEAVSQAQEPDGLEAVSEDLWIPLWKARCNAGLELWSACGSRFPSVKAANPGFRRPSEPGFKILIRDTAKQKVESEFAVYRRYYLERHNHLSERSRAMSSDGAEIRELKPRQEAQVGGDARGEEPELVRSERDHNRAAAQRMAANEAARCLPNLRQAASDIRLGQQLRQMAAFAGDGETEEKLKEVLEQLATAAAV